MEFLFIDQKSQLLTDVKVLWRKNASTLGFFPDDAFTEHARRKWILTATDNGRLCGYLLFRVASSKGRVSITHLCIEENYRGKGINKLLLDQLVKKFKETSLKGVGLSCREDYKAATKLWSKYGFKPINEKKGKNNEGYQLIYWWYDFEKPDLFSEFIDSSKIQAVVDANIIIHLRDPLLDHNQEAYALISDWVINEVEYYYAPEIYNEIIRDDDPERRRLTRDSLKRFKQLSVKKEECDHIFEKIISTVSGNSINDISDKKQLSEAICSGFEYFITRDHNLLGHAEIILEKFGISILKPNEFIIEIDELNNSSSYQPIRLAGANFNIQKVRSTEVKEVSNLFHASGEQESKKEFESRIISLTSDVKNTEIKVVKTSNDYKVALIGKRSCENSLIDVSVIRIKRDVGKLRMTLFNQLVFEIISEAVKDNQSEIKISDSYLSNEFQPILYSLGFINKSDSWVKISIRDLINSKDLLNKYPFISNYIEFKFMIKDIYEQQEIELKNKLKLKLEKRLFPIKFLDIDIPTFIIPIKPYWASHLFDVPSANQSLFGAVPELVWNRENVYYRSSRSNGLEFPARIIWYLSDQI